MSVGTVTAQPLYEIPSERYLNPDVITRFDTIQVEQEGPDRVLVHGTKDERAPATTKVCVNLLDGFRNSMTFCLAGLDIEEKVALVERTFWSHQKGGKEAFAQATTRLVRSGHANPDTNEAGVAMLTFTAKDPDERKVGRHSRTSAPRWRWRRSPACSGLGGLGAEDPCAVGATHFSKAM